MNSALLLALALAGSAPEPVAVTETPASVEVAASRRPRTVSRELSGAGVVSGSVHISCRGRDGDRRSRSVDLSGTVRLANSDGARADVILRGSIRVSGRCRGRRARMHGYGTVAGSATVYDARGRALGVVHVTESVSVSDSGYGSYHFEQPVRVSAVYR